jgi:hypothetical protein
VEPLLQPLDHTALLSTQIHAAHSAFGSRFGSFKFVLTLEIAVVVVVEVMHTLCCFGRW